MWKTFCCISDDVELVLGAPDPKGDGVGDTDIVEGTIVDNLLALQDTLPSTGLDACER